MEADHIGYDDKNEILKRMRMGTQWRWPIEFRNFEVFLRPLSIGEEIEVEARVAQAMKSKDQAYKIQINESAMKAKIVLEMASTSSPGKYDPQLTELTLNQFTNAELIAFMKEYQSICDKCDPSVDNLSRKQIDDMVSALKKTPPKDLRDELTLLSFWQARDLLTCITVDYLQRDS